MRGRSLAYWALVVAVAAVYFGAAKLGLTMALVAEQVTAVWPPTGIALAALVLFGNRLWPGIALGAFLANLTAHEPLASACGIALGNTLEAVLGAYLLRRFVEFRPYLGECLFSDCLHIDEEGCAIRQAVDDKVINERRYISYVRIMNGEER